MEEITEQFATQQKLLQLLGELQRHTGPVAVSIGYVENDIVQNGLVVKEAPPAIVNRLVSENYDLTICQDGAHISKIC